jgi:beta-N-acetylhexosaminidase
LKEIIIAITTAALLMVNIGNAAETTKEGSLKYYVPDIEVEEQMASMTLHEKVCQMVIVSTTTLTGVKDAKISGDITKSALEKYPVGGIIYDSKNIENAEQTKAMLSGAQSFSKIPLILTLDEEGGRVTRIMNILDTTKIGPMLDYESEGPEKAKENAKILAKDISAYGFNFDMAPVADVWSNPNNKVIGDRAYSKDFNNAAVLVSSAVEGFHEGGVGCTLKHFPGHGDTSSDSHYGAVYVYKTLDDLRANEFIPFKAGIEAGADAVMMGHLIVSDIDEEPAPFSKTIVTDILRNELHFTGVIMTDSLQMQAMTDHYGVGEVAVKAVNAGVDVLLMPMDLEETVSAIEAAVNDGTISEERINDSVRRILTMKKNLGIIQ